MKPLSFDITPLARTIKPALKEGKSSTPAPLPRAGVFPKYFPHSGGWGASLAQEQFHALATHLTAQSGLSAVRVIGVTSTLAGEGKTTVTLGLAEKLAEAGKRVLIVDLDTHRRTLTLAAQLGEVAGIRDAAETDLPAPCRPCATDRPGIAILPSGRVVKDQGEPLLEIQFLKDLVSRELDEYDFVLLDCPPIMPVAETHIVREVADGVVMVVRAGSTPRHMIEQSLSEFGQDKLLAAVLNRAQPRNIPYFRQVYGYYRRSTGSQS